MLRYRITGYRQLMKERRRRLLSNLQERGLENLPLYGSLSALTTDGPDELAISNLVLDLNGTLCCDGVIIPGAPELLRRIVGEGVRLTLLTANVRGTAAKVKERLDAEDAPIEVVECRGDQGIAVAKLEHLMSLGLESAAFIGNGQGDVLALQAVFGFALTQQELAATDAIRAAVGHAVCFNHVLRALLDERVMQATFNQ